MQLKPAWGLVKSNTARTDESLTLGRVGISHCEEGTGIGNGQEELGPLGDTSVVHVASDVHWGD